MDGLRSQSGAAIQPLLSLDLLTGGFTAITQQSKTSDGASRRSSVYFPVCSVHGGRLSQPAIRLLDVRPPLADIRLDAFLDLFQTVLLRCQCLVLEKGLGFVVPSPTRHIRLPGHFTMILTPVSILRRYCLLSHPVFLWGLL